MTKTLTIESLPFDHFILNLRAIHEKMMKAAKSVPVL